MRRASSSSRLLLRITDYGHDNTFFLAKHSMHFGSPLPSEGEGSQCPRLSLYQTSSQKCHDNLQSSVADFQSYRAMV